MFPLAALKPLALQIQVLLFWQAVPSLIRGHLLLAKLQLHNWNLPCNHLLGWEGQPEQPRQV